MQDALYSFNESLNIWQSRKTPSIGYSDGSEFESALLEKLKAITDLSTTSDELFSYIHNWPYEYHLSRVRHNLLRPFVFQSSDSILELGAGCGNLTRFLGESGARVTAVEGTTARASIIAERCRDLENVEVFQDNLQNFQYDDAFDIVTLIGVLEYSRVFVQSANPILSCLEKAKQHLKDDGILYLAIENQLGLKYFNGASEDHLGIPFFGINDLYHDQSAVTFGKHELTNLLKQAGFSDITFYYPFPDYKVPVLMLSEDGLDLPYFDPAQLLIRMISLDYTNKIDRSFIEAQAWAVLARNRLLDALSNSFLVVAKQAPQTKAVSFPWVAKSFSVNRLKPYCTETTFIHDAEHEKIIVNKKKLFSGHASSIYKLQLDDIQTYHSGNLYVANIYQYNFSKNLVKSLSIWIKPWFDYLSTRVIEKHKDFYQHFFTLTLPEPFIDCNPLNLIKQDTGELICIDQEWVADSPVPLYWVVLRGLMHCLGLLYQNSKTKQLTLLNLMRQMLFQYGIRLDEKIIKQFIARETAFIDAVVPVNFKQDFEKHLNQPLGFPRLLETTIKNLPHGILLKEQGVYQNAFYHDCLLE